MSILINVKSFNINANSFPFTLFLSRALYFKALSSVIVIEFLVKIQVKVWVFCNNKNSIMTQYFCNFQKSRNKTWFKYFVYTRNIWNTGFWAPKTPFLVQKRGQLLYSKYSIFLCKIQNFWLWRNIFVISENLVFQFLRKYKIRNFLSFAGPYQISLIRLWKQHS
jgi:hypothetical protein